MSTKKGISTVKVIVIATIAIVISWCLIQIPTWKEQWLYHFHQNQQIANAVKSSVAVNPFLTEDHSLSSHIIFQDLLLQAGANEKLVEQYRITAEEYSKSANVLAYYARVLGDEEKSQMVLTQAEELNPNDNAVLYLKAEKAIRNGKPYEAEQISRRMDDEKWYTHAVRAKAQYQSGKIDEAKNEYAAAIVCDGATTPLFIEYAEFLVDNNIDIAESPFAAWDEAEKIKTPLTFAYDEYLSGRDVSGIDQRLESGVAYSPDAMLILAKAALKQDHIDTAENLLNRAKRFEPQHPGINIYRGIVALKQGNQELADSLLQSSSQSGEDLTEIDHARIGLLLWNAGQTDSAMLHFQRAGTQVPALPEIALELAGSYLDQQECEKANVLIRKNLLTFIENQKTSFELAEKAKKCGALDIAAELYGAIVDSDFQNMEARVNLADIYVSRDEKNRAIQLYNIYFQLNPKSAFSLAKVAEIHYHFDTKDKAYQILEHIKQNESSFDDVSYAKELEKKWKAQQDPS